MNIAEHSQAPKRRSRTASPPPRHAAVLRLGFVPLLDAAPLLVAERMGFFRDGGLRVRIEPELGWGSIREKIVYGELDAAHAPGGLLFSVLCGSHARPRPVCTDFVLNLQGNAITLSRRLWEKGVRDAQTLRLLIRSEGRRNIVLAVPSPFSSHQYLLRKWLRSGGICPDGDVRIAILPPPLVAEHMREGQIDGFCVGDPWNSAVALDGEGWIVATSGDLDPGHPEKVLLLTEEMRRERADEYAAFREALVRACRFCDDPVNRPGVAELLDESRLFQIGREAIERPLSGSLPAFGGTSLPTRPFVTFHGNDTNRASRERAVWFLESVVETGALRLDARQRRLCLEAFHDETP